MYGQGMNVRSIIKTTFQHFHVSTSDFRLLGKLLVNKISRVIHCTVEHPVNHTKSKHILAFNDRLLIQTTVFQSLFR